MLAGAGLGARYRLSLLLSLPVVTAIVPFDVRLSARMMGIVGGRRAVSPAVVAVRIGAGGLQSGFGVEVWGRGAWRGEHVGQSALPAGLEMHPDADVTGVLEIPGDVGFGLAAKGTITPLVASASTPEIAGTTIGVPVAVSFLVTGLTVGSSYQFDLLGCSSGTATIISQGQSSTSLAANNAAPTIMTVQAV